MIKYHDNLDLCQLYIIEKYQKTLDDINKTDGVDLQNVINDICTHMLCISSKQDLQLLSNYLESINFSNILLLAKIPNSLTIRQFIMDATPYNNVSIEFEQFVSIFIKNIIKSIDTDALISLNKKSDNLILSQILQNEIKSRTSVVNKLKQVVQKLVKYDKK